MCTSKPKTPSIPKVVEPPVDNTANVAAREARDREAARRRAATGRDDTIATSPLGVSSAANVQRKTLLGQ